MSEQKLDYTAAGVDLHAADDAKERIRRIVESTFTPGVLGAFGGFGGMFRLPASPPDSKGPILVASADGVGTKIKVAIAAERHDSIGHDLVNHCVNDILVQGAVPLFFLDYVAFGRLVPSVVEAVVAGVAAGCVENGCALIGGETAEMPGMYTPPDYDLAGFIVGTVAAENPPGAERVRRGDVLVALASSGLHTNGYSLARKIVFERMGLSVDATFPGEDATVADVLLRVHRSYLTLLRPFLSRVHAMAHITGSGIPGNLNRVMPAHLSARVRLSSFTPPNVFRILQDNGGVSAEQMFDAFNMGVGMVVVCDETVAAEVQAAASLALVDSWVLGDVIAGNGSVEMT